MTSDELKNVRDDIADINNPGLDDALSAIDKWLKDAPDGYIFVSREAIEAMANIDAFNAPVGAAMEIKLAAQHMLRKYAIAQQDKGKETV